MDYCSVMATNKPDPPPETRTKVIIAKVTPEEHAEIHAAAEADGRTVSTLVRWLIGQWLKGRR